MFPLFTYIDSFLISIYDRKLNISNSEVLRTHIPKSDGPWSEYRICLRKKVFYIVLSTYNLCNV